MRERVAVVPSSYDDLLAKIKASWRYFEEHDLPKIRAVNERFQAKHPHLFRHRAKEGAKRHA